MSALTPTSRPAPPITRTCRRRPCSRPAPSARPVEAPAPRPRPGIAGLPARGPWPDTVAVGSSRSSVVHTAPGYLCPCRHSQAVKPLWFGRTLAQCLVSMRTSAHARSCEAVRGAYHGVDHGMHRMPYHGAVCAAQPLHTHTGSGGRRAPARPPRRPLRPRRRRSDSPPAGQYPGPMSDWDTVGTVLARVCRGLSQRPAVHFAGCDGRPAGGGGVVASSLRGRAAGWGDAAGACLSSLTPDPPGPSSSPKTSRSHARSPQCGCSP